MNFAKPLPVAGHPTLSKFIYARQRAAACAAMLLLNFILTAPAQSPPTLAARGLVERLLPDHAQQFILEIIPRDPDGDGFEIESQDGHVVVVGYFGAQRHYGFTVELSADGQRWDLVADRRANREPATMAGCPCVFPARPARYLRVTQNLNSANTGRHLPEVMTFDK
jgi:hypothetical protein